MDEPTVTLLKMGGGGARRMELGEKKEKILTEKDQLIEN